MSAALDTIRAFSATLSQELAQAVKQQDEATMEAFAEISERLDNERQRFIDNLNGIEETFSADIKAALDKRTRSMKENGAKLDAVFNEIRQIIAETRASYEDRMPSNVSRAA